MTWQLSTYERNGATGVAVLREDGSLVGPTELKRWASLMELLDDWDQAAGVCAGSTSPTPRSSSTTVCWLRSAGPARSCARV